MAIAARMISILDKTTRQNRGYFEKTDFAIGDHDLLFFFFHKMKRMKQKNKIKYIRFSLFILLKNFFIF